MSLCSTSDSFHSPKLLNYCQMLGHSSLFVSSMTFISQLHHIKLLWAGQTRKLRHPNHNLAPWTWHISGLYNVTKINNNEMQRIQPSTIQRESQKPSSLRLNRLWSIYSLYDEKHVVLLTTFWYGSLKDNTLPVSHLRQCSSWRPVKICKLIGDFNIIQSLLFTPRKMLRGWHHFWSNKT